MNSYAPQHSRLFKEMILVESSAKPFTYTAKNTPRRQAIINEYEPEIDAAYQAVRESSQTDVPSPESWDEISVLNFVRAIVQRVMGKLVGDDVNLFEHGCDRFVFPEYFLQILFLMIFPACKPLIFETLCSMLSVRQPSMTFDAFLAW
jgi:hypothetical protein